MPGKVAFKRKSEIGTELFEAVKEMLDMPGDAVPEGTIEKYQTSKKNQKLQKCGLLQICYYPAML